MSYMGHRSPSPGPSRPDASYIGFSARSDYPQRGREYSGEAQFSPPHRRPELPYYSRSPSPEYFPQPHDAWGREPQWHPPHPPDRWGRRRSPPPFLPPPVPEWNRPPSPVEWDRAHPRDQGPDNRFFEPSVNWRHSHGDHALRPELPSPRTITSPVQHPDERRWGIPSEPLPDRGYARPPKHDYYSPDDFRPPPPPFAPPRESYPPPPRPFRQHFDEPRQRGGQKHRGNRGGNRPSALGNYKLQQRQAHHRPTNNGNFEQSANPRPWGRRASPVSASSSRAENTSSPLSPTKVASNNQDQRNNNKLYDSAHRQPQNYPADGRPYSPAPEDSPERSGRRVSSESSIASSDIESDVASSRASSRSSSHSRHPAPLKADEFAGVVLALQDDRTDGMESEEQGCTTSVDIAAAKANVQSTRSAAPSGTQNVTGQAIHPELGTVLSGATERPAHLPTQEARNPRDSTQSLVVDDLEANAEKTLELNVAVSLDPSTAPSRNDSPDSQSVEPGTSRPHTNAKPTSSSQTRSPAKARHLPTAGRLSPQLDVLHVRPAMDSKSMADALKIAITARRKHDHQTRAQRVNPILISNLSISDPQAERVASSPEAVVREVFEAACSPAYIEAQKEIRPLLAARFAERQALLSEKTQKLRAKYWALHEKWLVNCAGLDSLLRGGGIGEAAVTTGRTTRRSAATLGDAVRSDLEMEQIIASLGNEDLTDPNNLAVRNVATVPDMISVEKVYVEYQFDDTNKVVDDPATYYDSRTGFTDWSPQEEEIFFSKYAEYPKQFGTIASFLPHKTTSQCVLYYYIHKKRLVNFRSAANAGQGRRRKGPRKVKGNALLADIQEHEKDKPAPTRRRRGPAAGGEYGRSNSRRSAAQAEATPDVESKPKRRRANASARAVAVRELEPEDDGSMDTESNRDPPRKTARRPRKPKVVNSPADSPAPAETKFIDVNETLGRRRLPATTSYWSIADKDEFLRLLARHGKNFKRIAASMPNKTTIQVSNYFKGHMVDLDLEKVASAAQSHSPSPEPLARDQFPFVHDTATSPPASGVVSRSSAPPDGPQAHVGAHAMQPVPPELNAPLSREEMQSTFMAFEDLAAQDRKLGLERQIWVQEEFALTTQQPPQPQKGFMSVLHPSTFRMETPFSMEGHQQLGNNAPPAQNPMQPSPFAPAAFQFSAYMPPSLPSKQPLPLPSEKRGSSSGKLSIARRESAGGFVHQEFSPIATGTDATHAFTGAMQMIPSQYMVTPEAMAQADLVLPTDMRAFIEALNIPNE